ncbi:MAG: amidohydrolase family protein [Bacillota bacterium]|nr:amidohydrolase family protein [Bacillota bacterium]
MIIDFHVHCFPDALAPKAVQLLAKRAGTPPRLNGMVGDIKSSMNKAGVDYSVILPIATKPEQTKTINNWAAQIQGEKIVSFGSIHPDYLNWKDELKKIKELGLKGIKFHPDYQDFFVDDRKMYPIYEEAFKRDLVVIFHAGVDIGLPAPYHCEPEMLKKILKDLKGGRIVAAHMGGHSYWDDVEKYLVGEDIYFDTAYSIKVIETDQTLRIIRGHGSDKILFATDSPWTDQKEEIERMKGFGLTEKEYNSIMGDNARKLLNM